MKLLFPLAKRFIAGYDFSSAKKNIAQLMDDGYQVSIDYVGELSKTSKQAARAASQYVEISNYYKGKRIDISIKPTQLGLLFDKFFCKQLLYSVVRTAKLNNHTVRLDMEDSKVTDDTIKLAIWLNEMFGNVGVAIQANLYRTKEDIWQLFDNNVSIRLVKGAYKENSTIAVQPPDDVSGCYMYFANIILEYSKAPPAIATHDEKIIKEINKYKNRRFDYEFLYGIRRDLQKELKLDGHRVRVYVPFGEQWFPYVLRRLKEWKNLKFVFKSLIKEWF